VGKNVDKHLSGMVIIFNAGAKATSQQVYATAGHRYRLDPLQRNGTDPVVKTAGHDLLTGTFTVPARTVAVFEAH
jgi:hypothetical protein